jgi:hypothetical protein
MNNRGTKRGAGKAWVAAQQGKHYCQCGCDGVIFIQIHHHVRGIPRFINGHTSRVANPMAGRVGDLNPNFNGGRYANTDGYICILIPGPGRSKYILEHRLVMERHIGRPLLSDEVIHHKNGNKQDNRIENLELMTSSDHSLHHAIRGEVGFLLAKRKK